MTSNMIYIVALGGGFKCPCKIHLNTQRPPLCNHKYGTETNLSDSLPPYCKHKIGFL